MRIFLMCVCILFSVFAVAKKEGLRKPAETHGGVLISNAQFEAVTKYALGEGGDLSRVFGIRRLIDCHTADGAVYEITYGGQSSQAGKQYLSETGKTLVIASEPADGAADVSSIRVAAYAGKDCKQEFRRYL